MFNACFGGFIRHKFTIMKKGYVCSLVFSGLMFASCASYQQTAPILGLGNNAINTYVAADIDYQSAKKVTATIETHTVFGFNVIRNGNKTLKSSNHYRGIKKRESQALYKAKTESGVDMILDPEFECEKHSYFFGLFRKSRTTVNGWGVMLKGIKEDKH